MLVGNGKDLVPEPAVVVAPVVSTLSVVSVEMAVEAETVTVTRRNLDRLDTPRVVVPVPEVRVKVADMCGKRLEVFGDLETVETV